MAERQTVIAAKPKLMPGGCFRLVAASHTIAGEQLPTVKTSFPERKSQRSPAARCGDYAGAHAYRALAGL